MFTTQSPIRKKRFVSRRGSDRIGFVNDEENIVIPRTEQTHEHWGEVYIIWRDTYYNHIKTIYNDVIEYIKEHKIRLNEDIDFEDFAKFIYKNSSGNIE